MSSPRTLAPASSLMTESYWYRAATLASQELEGLSLRMNSPLYPSGSELQKYALRDTTVKVIMIAKWLISKKDQGEVNPDPLAFRDIALCYDRLNQITRVAQRSLASSTEKVWETIHYDVQNQTQTLLDALATDGNL